METGHPSVPEHRSFPSWKLLLTAVPALAGILLAACGDHKRGGGGDPFAEAAVIGTATVAPSTSESILTFIRGPKGEGIRTLLVRVLGDVTRIDSSGVSRTSREVLERFQVPLSDNPPGEKNTLSTRSGVSRREVDATAVGKDGIESLLSPSVALPDNAVAKSLVFHRAQ